MTLRYDLDLAIRINMLMVEVNTTARKKTERKKEKKRKKERSRKFMSLDFAYCIVGPYTLVPGMMSVGMIVYEI